MGAILNEKEIGGDSAAKLLNKDEARRIAASIAKLPEPGPEGGVLRQSQPHKKDPSRAGIFLYANKSGARGVGGWGKRPTLWLFWTGDYSESV